MLDSYAYRMAETAAKQNIRSWRYAEIHNVDHFEKVGFPVRIASTAELAQLVDTMQENRFEGYMDELGGWSPDELEQFLDACEEAVRFQLIHLPHVQPIIPFSTLASAFCLFANLRGYKADFSSVLEIGPGCGYLSFFLRRHANLENYTQAEACESFYILQNLINAHVFGVGFEEQAYPRFGDAIEVFTNDRYHVETHPHRLVGFRRKVVCRHYPWWRLGDLWKRTASFEIATSNANLMEFHPWALDDYLTLIEGCLTDDGIFYVQCTGYPAHGTVDSLFDLLCRKGFAPLLCANEKVPIEIERSESRAGGLLARFPGGWRTSSPRTFTVNSLLLAKAKNPRFNRYHDRANFHWGFVAPEPEVERMFFARPQDRKVHSRDELATMLHERIVSGCLSAHRTTGSL